MSSCVDITHWVREDFKYYFADFVRKFSWDIESHRRSEVWGNIWSGNLRHAGGWINQTTGHCGRESKEYLQQVFEKTFGSCFDLVLFLKDGREQWWYIDRGGVPEGLPSGDNHKMFISHLFKMPFLQSINPTTLVTTIKRSHFTFKSVLPTINHLTLTLHVSDNIQSQPGWRALQNAGSKCVHVVDLDYSTWLNISLVSNIY